MKQQFRNKLAKSPPLSTKKLTIGLVIDDSLDSSAGVQQYIMTLGSWLSSHGHNVHYLSSHTTQRKLPNIHSLGPNLPMRFNGGRMRIPLPVSGATIRKLLSAQNFDILHIQMPYSPLLAGRVIKSAQSSTAVVGTFHVVPKSAYVKLISYLLALANRQSARRFDAVYSVSAAAQDFAISVFGLTSIIRPNAINSANFRNAQLLSEAKKSSTQTILFFGSLVPRKGCLTLLKAIKLLKNDYPNLDFKVIICGDGPLRNRLTNFVKSNGLSNYVKFVGFVSEADKPSYYASADVTVFPSSGGESFGIALLEAMSSGRSVILAGNNAGYQTLLGGCPEEVLFDSKNIRNLADKLYLVLSDRPTRKIISRWQKQRAKDFDIEIVGPQLLSDYYLALQSRCNVP